MERESDAERAAERPTEGLDPEDAKPADDAPSDRDLKPSADTDRVIEEKGREPREG